MTISATVMAHPKRKVQAEKLYRTLKKYPFVNVSITYDEINDEWHTGERALLDGVGKADWHVIVQDDAILADKFYEHIVNAITYVPERTLISLYTGTLRPYGERVKAAVEKATYCAWLRSHLLYWGVGIVVPTWHIEHIVEMCKGREEQYDVRIGTFYQTNMLPVWYTNPSLVDHDDDLGSLLGHGQAPGRREAHRFAGSEPISWNRDFIVI